jgi:hypothetical protein
MVQAMIIDQSRSASRSLKFPYVYLSPALSTASLMLELSGEPSRLMMTYLRAWLNELSGGIIAPGM